MRTHAHEPHEARAYTDGRWECLICKRPIKQKHVSQRWVLAKASDSPEKTT